MEETTMIVAKKIPMKKKMALVWLLMIALVVGFFAYSFISYRAYYEKQSLAIAALCVAHNRSADGDRETLCNDFYHGLAPRYGGTFTINGITIDNSEIAKSQRKVIDAAQNLFEEMFDYNYLPDPRYHFEFTSFGEYLAGMALYNRKAPSEERMPLHVFAMGTGLFLLLFIPTQIIHKKNSKDELFIQDDVVTYRRKKKTISIPAARITGVKRGGYKSVKVKSPGGKFRISMLQNQVEIVNAITDLMNNAAKSVPVPAAVSAPVSAPVVQAPAANDLEQLTKLKELLDAGVLTQEEFDAKKKQILNL